MWTEFNIKTFDAETLVYRDGVFCPELSTLNDTNINQTLTRPVHVIYVGKISGDNTLSINITAENQPVYISAKITNDAPATLKIAITNNGKNSAVHGYVVAQNHDKLTIDCTAHHTAPDTTILIKNKLLAHENTVSKLSGVAVIDSKCTGTISDVGFSAIAADNARIEFTPAQRISAAPKSADHSASIYHASPAQIQYLRMAGLATTEVKSAITDAFLNETFEF